MAKWIAVTAGQSGSWQCHVSLCSTAASRCPYRHLLFSVSGHKLVPFAWKYLKPWLLQSANWLISLILEKSCAIFMPIVLLLYSDTNAGPHLLHLQSHCGLVAIFENNIGSCVAKDSCSKILWNTDSNQMHSCLDFKCHLMVMKGPMGT